MIIREMEARDVMGVVGLIRNELGYDDISSDVYDRVMRIYNAENYVTFIAEEDESVIGFVGIMRGLAFELDGEYVRIIALAVSRGYQSLGVGSKLEARVEQYATETGANSIVISSGLNRNRAHVFIRATKRRATASSSVCSPKRSFPTRTSSTPPSPQG